MEPLSRAVLVPMVHAVLGIPRDQSEKVVRAFDDFVARPLRDNLAKLTGRELARRNPMIYTTRGVTTVSDWVDWVLADKETSAIEAHLGTWQEEVARIVSGGIKPGSGVDLQIDREDGVVELYAIQGSHNTKNAGGRRHDVEALKRAARPLRASRRHVEMKIGVLSGRPKSASMRSEPDIEVLASDDFWERVSGIPDFRARLLRATIALASLIKSRSAEELLRIKGEAIFLFADVTGGIDLEALANPPRAERDTTRP
jgi:hypothetical protein